jgi:hypothetical protein
VPKFDQERSNTAHTTACYANKMNPVLLTRQECWQVKRQITHVAC